MLALFLEIDTDEPHDLNVRRRKRLPRDSWESAKLKAWQYALDAIELYCDTSNIHPTTEEKVAAGLDPNALWGTTHLIKEAPSTAYPLVTISDADQLRSLQQEGRAPSDLEIDEHTIRVGFAGRQGEPRRGHRNWDGWTVTQDANGDVHADANNCHVIDLNVTIKEI